MSEPRTETDRQTQLGNASASVDLEFPERFLWGTATAAHQVEGGNWNNDWWAWEHRPDSPCTEPSGDACDHLFRYPDDIALLADLGFDTYRFSIEWSRVEPEEGEYSRQALDHYRRMAETCREHAVTPIVTLHHFTSPRWVAAEGSWENPSTAERFARYAGRAVAAFGDLAGAICTINEPNVVALYGYRVGVFPPGRAETAARTRAIDTFLDGHRRATAAIKAHTDTVPVGLTVSMADYQVTDGGAARMERYRARMEDVFLEALEGDDFVGVQAYTRERIGPEGRLPPEDGVETTLMGYEFWPQALEATVRRAHTVTAGTPIIVTENGIGTHDDARRIDYVDRALRGLHRCIGDGIEVAGYLYWTLLDNFEWLFGYRPTFGLVAVDRDSFTRTPKPSARWLGDVARTNVLPARAAPPSADREHEGR